MYFSLSLYRSVFFLSQHIMLFIIIFLLILLLSRGSSFGASCMWIVLTNTCLTPHPSNVHKGCWPEASAHHIMQTHDLWAWCLWTTTREARQLPWGWWGCRAQGELQENALWEHEADEEECSGSHSLTHLQGYQHHHEEQRACSVHVHAHGTCRVPV